MTSERNLFDVSTGDDVIIISSTVETIVIDEEDVVVSVDDSSENVPKIQSVMVENPFARDKEATQRIDLVETPCTNTVIDLIKVIKTEPKDDEVLDVDSIVEKEVHFVCEISPPPRIGWPKDERKLRSIMYFRNQMYYTVFHLLATNRQSVFVNQNLFGAGRRFVQKFLDCINFGEIIYPDNHLQEYYLTNIWDALIDENCYIDYGIRNRGFTIFKTNKKLRKIKHGNTVINIPLDVKPSITKAETRSLSRVNSRTNIKVEK